jgi:ABC-type lipoprotein export system ATPase subunit
MPNFVKSLNIVGLHGQFDISCELQDGVNVIFGKNGTGKTTLLHVIANVLNRDFIRFSALEFKSIEVEFSDGNSIKIETEKIPKNDHFHYFIIVNGEKINKKEICPLGLRRDLERNRRFFREEEEEYFFQQELEKIPKVGLSAAYFPAFRTAIDAWAINQEDEARRPPRRHLGQGAKTEFARSLFGQFVPSLDYPATVEIEQELNEKIKTAITNVSRADRTYFGRVPSKILESFSNNEHALVDTEEIFQGIEELSRKFQEYPIQVESLSANLSESIRSLPDDPGKKLVAGLVLSAYQEALSHIVAIQEQSFSEVERYLKSVNTFLENKSLQISQIGSSRRGINLSRYSSPSIVMKLDGDDSRPMNMSQTLSSGERQIVTLIYATTKMSQRDIVLVDEPEISLNVDWQRKLLPEMVKQMPSKQGSSGSKVRIV